MANVKFSKEYEKLIRLFKDKGFENYFTDYISDGELDEIYDSTDLYDILQDRCFFNVDIIYYHNAIDYLKNNDASLLQSIELAQDYGYEIEAINSELLASILASYKQTELFYDISDKIDDILNDMD